MTQDQGPAYILPFVAGVIALAAFFFLQDAAFLAAGGIVEYPLDDPYIHLAMAEQIANGGYGVNEGEYAAAASSILYPVLLLPGAGESWHRLMPLVWNWIGLLMSALLWGRIVWQSGVGAGLVGMALAALGPILLHMVGVAFTGMEHALHVAATLAIVSGLITYLGHDRIEKLLLAGILLSPLLRFEGLALAMAAAGIVFVRGRYLAGLGLLVLAAVPVAGFVAYLTSLGLDPLPSSVTTKLAVPEASGEGLQRFLRSKIGAMMFEPVYRLFAVFLLVGVALLAIPQVRKTPRVWLVLAVLAAGLAHVAVGRFGWMDRYEIYAMVMMAAGFLAAAAVQARLVLLPAIAIALMGSYYLPGLVTLYPTATAPVYLQQGQMARLAKVHLEEPVAVNDLGYVAWSNPNYVLDLWGLASQEARRLRMQEDAPAGWADMMTDARDVRVAMIYDTAFPDALGDDWIRLGVLRLEVPKRYVFRDEVAIYLTRQIDPAPFLVKLRAWAEGLPEGARFEVASEFAR